MPREKYKGRGRVLRYRTLKLPKGKYMHIAIVSKAGKEGGHTISGIVHTKNKYVKHSIRHSRK